VDIDDEQSPQFEVFMLSTDRTGFVGKLRLEMHFSRR
jgi:hypothetical protein